MHWNHWTRQGHRWLSIAFTVIVAGIFFTLGIGQKPASWVYFLPLFPLGLLTLTGLCMFFLPYVAKYRRRVGA